MKFDMLNSVEILMDFYYQRNEYVMSEKSKSIFTRFFQFYPSAFDKLHRKWFPPSHLSRGIKFHFENCFRFAESGKKEEEKNDRWEKI